MQPLASKPIFIGGTGRSGTSIVKRILARHSQLFGLRSEARFFTDPDGLLDLADALSTRFSGMGSDKALRRFDDMLRGMRTMSFGYRAIRRISSWLGTDLFEIVSPGEYAAYGNGRDFGLAHYDRTVAEFLREIEAFRFRGLWPGSRPYRLLPVVRQGRHYSRPEILEKCRRFVHQLYAHQLAERHKAHWIEDTPGNVIRAVQLFEMFPDMKLVHVFRDPRDVVASYSTKRWAPSDHALSVGTIADHIAVWRDIRDQLPPASVFLLRFEDLIAAPQAMLERLCEFLELPFEAALAEIDLSRHNIGRYRKQLSPETIALTERVLSAWMDENAYLVAGAEPAGAASIGRLAAADHAVR